MGRAKGGFRVANMSGIRGLRRSFLNALHDRGFGIHLSTSSFQCSVSKREVLTFCIPSSSLGPVCCNGPSGAFVEVKDNSRETARVRIVRVCRSRSFNVHSRLSVPSAGLRVLGVSALRDCHTCLGMSNTLPRYGSVGSRRFYGGLGVLSTGNLLACTNLLVFKGSPCIATCIPAFYVSCVRVPNPAIRTTCAECACHVPRRRGL